MSIRKLEKSSPDWALIQRRYEGETLSIRALARDNHTSDTEIRRRAKSRGWVRYSDPLVVQHKAQQPQESERPWDIAPRRDALMTALSRSRQGVETVVDSIYCDLAVVMALLWFRTPLMQIARAVELTEEQLEGFYGPAIMKFIRQHYAEPKQSRRTGKPRRAARLG
ncbi:hypothetical protein [Bradyrhizobium sp. AUGA SZCCT0182]|uniref:hypothetical protein n=1 Tax=Bradyrhizobium sp. AUGA SZCCT0182 TaxID=2807667 RepID=UPI001BAB6910|nr:hypothetical protein [Bradyrhizobium sp. AUGA SZCCT0182]MBR1231978.1 hypothetical protein [Bradyrhizobium sp. AUGA SZCCT0182]